MPCAALRLPAMRPSPVQSHYFGLENSLLYKVNCLEYFALVKNGLIVIVVIIKNKIKQGLKYQVIEFKTPEFKF